MHTGNGNKPFRGKIEGLEEVPEAFHFNTAATWQTLEKRLQKKTVQQRKIPLLYAAASVLVIFLSFWSYRSSVKSPSTTTATQPNIQRPATTLPDYTVTKKIQAVEAVKEPKASAAPTHHLIRKQHSREVETKTNELAFESPVEVLQLPVEIHFQQTLPLAGTAIAAQKPKYKIAHINDLNSQPPANNVLKNEKGNAGFALRKDHPVDYNEDREQVASQPVPKPKSFFNLLNTQ